MKTNNEILLRTMEQIVDKKLPSSYFDKTFPTVIYGKNGDGTYKIIREEIMYDVPNALGVELSIGQSVWVTVPCGAGIINSLMWVLSVSR